ncbi:hypothetical protein DPEC_G00326070 [Dallia pectoralis]|uniref:Uncharacterized protein n=1 Tax=Dallia pectoralis TaxID=75939 RepID=A0ACC2F7P8_DALPE|nr:hypothetical protein DPEC_G00326070 [Dallia pectoralis]
MLDEVIVSISTKPSIPSSVTPSGISDPLSSPSLHPYYSSTFTHVRYVRFLPTQSLLTSATTTSSFSISARLKYNHTFSTPPLALPILHSISSGTGEVVSAVLQDWQNTSLQNCMSNANGTAETPQRRHHGAGINKDLSGTQDEVLE